MRKASRVNASLRNKDLAEAAAPKDEVQRVAQIVLSVIQHPDGLETIDWEIARAIVADRNLRLVPAGGGEPEQEPRPPEESDE